MPQPKRVETTPLRDGDQAQEDHRQNQKGGEANHGGRLVFRSLFTDATQAGLTVAKGTPVHAPERTDHEKSEFVRREKRPEKRPVSLSDQDTNGLFAYLAAVRQAAEANAAKATTPQAQSICLTGRGIGQRICGPWRNA